jgi:predicted nucleotidyltransferase
MQRDHILELARRRGVSNVRVFGSVARGEASLTSDLDLLLDMDPERSMLDLGGFAMEVSELLESRVDVVEADALGGRMRERVLEEAVSL